VQLLVNPADDLPIYRQIMRQIIEAIAAGRLTPGEKLPSHRDLSEQLVVAPLTVKKAYDELEALGYLETHRGRGTFIAAHLPQPDPAQQRDQVRQAARTLLTQASFAGLDLPEIIEILHQEHQALTPQVLKEKS
jgi:GntR family transcriptional regulator